MNSPRPLSRRHFLTISATALAASASPFRLSAQDQAAEPIIDIHQHTDYARRKHQQLLAHQRAMGITTTILLPSGRPVKRPSTHNGVANGLQAEASGNEVCYNFAKEHSANKEFVFGANEVPDLDDALEEIKKYLKLGAVCIGESKFGLECDSEHMQKIYQLAQAHDVPVLLHFQHNMYNLGFDRFYKMLEKYPKVNFIGHAQTWWANIDRDHKDQRVLYPKGKITPGGITDRYLSDYPNMFGDLSAGSGLGALERDEEHTRTFFKRHEDKLLYGSDCNDTIGRGLGCQGARTLAAIRRLAPSKEIERKLLYGNSKKLFKL